MAALTLSPIQMRDAKGHIMKGNIPVFKGTKGVHLGNGMLGKKLPESWKANLRKPKSVTHPRSEETKQKLREKAVLRVGALNSHWKGGVGQLKSRKRREKIVANGGSHTQGEWATLKAQYNWTCPCCGIKEPERFLTQDHIIPVSKGGSNNIENIQPLCGPCNGKKHTQIIKY